ncbi:MAG: hypothetical protein IPN03_08825 [Holophagales bacterium]|nr:hypothetical protein [Holophagales bacterium]
MPTLIPSLPIPPTPAASAAGEAKVLLAFQSLRDDFRIYHRKSWYSFDGPDGSREESARARRTSWCCTPTWGCWCWR